jgi:protein-L-isoaspartate O-methyltransferase
VLAYERVRREQLDARTVRQRAVRAAWRQACALLERLEEKHDIPNNKRGVSGSFKYGTIRASFVAQLITQLSINLRSPFVDVGSGIGLVCLLIALVTGATVCGVELRRELHLIALRWPLT